MASGSGRIGSKAKGTTAALSRRQSRSAEALPNGAKPFVTVPRAGGKETVAITETDGVYQFQGHVSQPGRVDTSSAEYKRALREYNVKAQFSSDGSVTVQKGGLYSRKRTFKSSDDFVKDAHEKLDSSIAYNESVSRSALSGRMSQIHAENAKSTFRNHTLADAWSIVGKELSDTAKSANTMVAAAQDMKRRLDVYVSNHKKK